MKAATPAMNLGMAAGTHGGSQILSVVIPCYNEAPVLQALYDWLAPVCRQAFPDRHEIVLVDDGSRDGTWDGIRELARLDPAVVGVNLSRNHGHQLALSAGLSVCRGDQILIIDADLQDPPELLPAMLEVMAAEGADVVYGTRATRDGETSFKKGSAALFYRVLDRLVDIDIPKDTGDFRLMSRRALDLLNSMPERDRFIRGMVSWIGLKQVAFPYDRNRRFAGETKYPLSKMLVFAADAITGFSVKPLRAASWLGVAFGVVGLALLFYAIGSWALGTSVTGWTSLITVVLLLGSTQLFVLGIMGEYLGRLYMESKRRPLFIIEGVLRAPARAALSAGGSEERALSQTAA